MMEKKLENNNKTKDTSSEDKSGKKDASDFWFSQGRIMCILWIWLILFSVIGLSTCLFGNLYQYGGLFKTLILSFSAGGIGASLYSIRMLYYHSHLCEKYNRFDEEKRKEFNWDRGWIWFYLNRPILGAFVGFVTYVLILCGFLDLKIGNKSSVIAIGLGWLAGYNVTELIHKLEDVASAVFGYEREQTPFGRLKELVHSENNGYKYSKY